MPYDRALAQRIRVLMAVDVPTEVPAFGGLAFLLGGNMSVAAGSKGDLIVHCAAERTDEFLAAGAGPMLMRGRPIRGWLSLEPEAVDSEADLARWVAVGREHARALPPK